MRIHRTTWIALPILALVIAGTGTGWWGYQQYRERQALALQVTNTYNAAFHGLTGNLEKVHEELGEVMVSGDRDIISQHMQNIARLSFAASADASHLPASALPNGRLQAFTRGLGDTAEQDAIHADPTPKLRKQVQTAWTETGKMLTVLHQADITTQYTRARSVWTGSGHATMLPTFAASLQQLDTPPMSNSVKGRGVRSTTSIPSSTVAQTFRHFTRLQAERGWEVHAVSGSQNTAFRVTGKTQDGLVYGSVSPGLQVLSFHDDRVINQATPRIGVAEAQKRALQWLASRGLTPVSLTETTNFDHTVYFTFSPQLDGIPVLAQPMVVQVALDRGDVIGYTGGAFEKNRFQRLPARRYTAQQLQRKLSPLLAVGEQRSVIALDQAERPQPAVAFYGTSNRETFCVVVNANTGKEMRVTQLTNHS